MSQNNTQWRQLSPLQLVREIEAVASKLRFEPRDSQVGKYYRAVLDDASLEIERRLGVVANHKWNNHPKTQAQLESLLFLRAELHGFLGELKPSLSSELERCIGKMQSALGHKDSLDAQNEEFGERLTMPITCEAATELSISTNSVYSAYSAIKSSPNLSAIDIRRHEMFVRRATKRLDEQHPMQAVLKNIDARLIEAKKAQLKQYPTSKKRLVASKRLDLSFNTKVNGFAFGFAGIQAKVIGSEYPQKGTVSVALLKSLPWFTKHEGTHQHLNHQVHYFSRSITVVEHEAQYTFEDTPDARSIKIGKRLLRGTQAEQIVVWGSAAFCKAISKHCRKSGVKVKVLTSEELEVIKGRVEQRLSKTELENTQQHRIAGNTPRDTGNGRRFVSDMFGGTAPQLNLKIA